MRLPTHPFCYRLGLSHPLILSLTLLYCGFMSIKWEPNNGSLSSSYIVGNKCLMNGSQWVREYMNEWIWQVHTGTESVTLVFSASYSLFFFFFKSTWHYILVSEEKGCMDEAGPAFFTDTAAHLTQCRFLWAAELSLKPRCPLEGCSLRK